MYKVLIVDDEPFILEGLKHIIDWEDLGLEIVGKACYGTEALDLIEKNRIHILITDIKMPFMNGIELIKHIRVKGINIKCIVLSGYDDFEYVKEAARLGIENYLLKPVSENELTATLLNSINKIESDLCRKIELNEGIGILKNNILYRWVTNDIQKSELTERASLLSINLNCKKYFVVNFNIFCCAEESKSIKIDDKNLLRYAAQNIIEQTVTESVPAVIFPDLDGDILAIFSDTTIHQEKLLFAKTLPECIKNLNSCLGISVFITTGGLENEYKNVHKSYSQAKDLQAYRLIIPPNKILSFDEVSSASNNETSEHQIDYNALSSLIISKKREAALKLVDSFYNSLSPGTGISPSKIQNITIELLFNISNAIKSLKVNAPLQDFNDVYASVLKIKSIEELMKWLRLIINKSVDFLLLDDEKNNTLIPRILVYLEANYAKDINLKTIASEFNNNAAYLGQIFKKETGETFTNYLNKVRIEKAKELLLHSNMKANEISEIIGYFSANYFYTIFKKYTGVSPTEYKE